MNWGGPFQEDCRAPLKRFGVDIRPFRADPYQNYMAISIKCGGPLKGDCRAPLKRFGVDIRPV